MDRKNEIRQFLSGLLAEKGDARPLTDDGSLIFSGRLDSMNTVEILLFLEKNYAIRLTGDSFQQSDLDSIDSIDALVRTHSGKSA